MAGERKGGSNVKDVGNIKGILEMRRGVFFAKSVKEYQLQSDNDDATTELKGDCTLTL